MTVDRTLAIRDIVLALISLALAAASLASYRNDLASRRTVSAFVTDFELNLRRPDVATTVALAPRFDVAADILADATLRDAVLPVNLREVEAPVRASWIKAMSRLDDEFGAAQSLTLEAIVSRPGWPYHQSLLGQLAFQRASRSFDPTLTTEKERWRLPLLHSATDAGSDITLWQSLALGYLQTWPALSRADRQSAPAIFRRAFAEPDFVTDLFAPASQILGVRETIGLLPDKAPPLWEAFQQIVRGGDVDSAWLVHRRWDADEWKGRADELAAIEVHAKRGDLDDARALCESWAARHSVWNYDSPAAHRQASHLLEMWPSGRQGSWDRDPRAEVLRYLIDKRYEYASGQAIERSLAALDGVPSATRAQILVISGDVDGARSIAKGADDLGTLAWTPYLLAAAREARKRGDPLEARRLLAQISPAAADECDTRHAEATIDLTIPKTAADSRILLHLPVIAVGDAQSVCVPPSGGRVSIELLADHPQVVDWSLNGARRGSYLIGADGRAVLSDWLRGGYALITSKGLP